MGLDIYTGRLTRYYSGNWKSIAQQYAEEQGIDFHTTRVNEPDDVITDPVKIQEIVQAWIQHLGRGLKPHTDVQINWQEDNNLEYDTDKPGWDCYGALLLWAVYAENKKKPPELVEDWTTDKLYEASLSTEYETSYSALLNGIELWLPIDVNFTFRFSDSTNNEVGIGSTFRLKEDLDRLNGQTWNSDITSIQNWRMQIDPSSKIFEEQAKFGFSILYQLVTFSVNNGTPIKLDY